MGQSVPKYYEMIYIEFYEETKKIYISAYIYYYHKFL